MATCQVSPVKGSARSYPCGMQSPLFVYIEARFCPAYKIVPKEQQKSRLLLLQSWCLKDNLFFPSCLLVSFSPRNITGVVYQLMQSPCNPDFVCGGGSLWETLRTPGASQYSASHCMAFAEACLPRCWHPNNRVGVRNLNRSQWWFPTGWKRTFSRGSYLVLLACLIFLTLG